MGKNIPDDCRRAAVLLGLLVMMAGGCRKPVLDDTETWAPVGGKIMTRWSEKIDPDRVHAEYPRPQMMRDAWLNLNGLWDCAIRPVKSEAPERFDGKILVPFAVESALSGVGKTVGPDNRLWYRRRFKIPRSWKKKRVLLHFEAVDWEVALWVNGKPWGSHKGGYDPFSFDITDALSKRKNQDILLSVWDPIDTGTQPRGKQVAKPHGIWYTPVTGIWRTVWLEPVADVYIESLKIVPDLDGKQVRIRSEWKNAGSGFTLQAEALINGIVQASGRSGPGGEVVLELDKFRSWSPESPFLYNLIVRLLDTEGRVRDAVVSYFGMRKIAVRPDGAGIQRMFLNDRPYFQFGPLDQGWWPDGLYTAPSDEALRYDIDITKSLGFNMLRKHVKVESRRFYYWCDRLGILVWQDMPSGDAFIGKDDPDVERSPESALQYQLELRRMLESLFNHPSIVMWVPFNEGWGQFSTAAIADWIRGFDPTRLIDSASGWADRGVGDVHDIHSYPGPAAPPNESRRAAVLGEFGGLGLPVPGHTWRAENNWGYRSFRNEEELTEAYEELLEKLRPMVRDGLSAAVYTQTTDVEIEVNGLMTYDRALVKMEVERIAPRNRRIAALLDSGERLPPGG